MRALSGHRLKCAGVDADGSVHITCNYHTLSAFSNKARQARRVCNDKFIPLVCQFDAKYVKKINKKFNKKIVEYPKNISF